MNVLQAMGKLTRVSSLLMAVAAMAVAAMAVAAMAVAAMAVAGAKEVKLGDAVMFTAPDHFTALTRDEIELKFPSNRAPAYVVGDESRRTTIAYDLKPHDIPEDRLQEVKASFEDLFAKIIPGLQWVESKLITLAGRRWLYLELTSSAVDTDIHNIMLVTPYQQQMLVFNFNSTREDFPQVEASLRKSIDSIRFLH